MSNESVYQFTFSGYSYYEQGYTRHSGAKGTIIAKTLKEAEAKYLQVYGINSLGKPELQEFQEIHPQQPHAHWEWDGQDCKYNCSNCKSVALNDSDGYSVKSKYCHFCGAKMMNEEVTNEKA